MRTTEYSKNNIHTATTNDKARQARRQHRQSSRVRTVYLQKCTMAISAIVILTGMILLGTGIRAFAGSTHSSQELHTYYTSIEVEQGDTLWDIAQEYTFGTGIHTQDYIEEVCTLNHLSDPENIHEGNCIVIPYYSYEDK